MKTVYKLPDLSKKDLIILKEFDRGSLFNPIQDDDGNWIISEEEVIQCKKDEFNFVKYLSVIPFNPVEYDLNGKKISKDKKDGKVK